MLLYHGLFNSNGSPLFDKKTNPTNNEFKSKIECRWNAFVFAGKSTVPPHPMQVALPKVLTWLNNNLITDAGDIVFLLEKIKK